MEKTIRADELKVGMYVILKLSWLQHPFANNQFVIESESQIQKILGCGVKTAVIDTEKSKIAEDKKSPLENQPTAPVKKEVEAQMPPQNPYEVNMEQSDLYNKLSEVAGSKTIMADDKAKAVRHLSLIMMSNLLTKPTELNIAQAKRNIFRIVDLIIKDDEIAKHLLNITSHDYRTYTHSVTVGILGITLSKELFKGSDAHDLHEIGAGFFLHDIGKANIDLAIINKPGKLTDGEMDIIRQHPEYGYQILEKTKQLTDQCAHIIMEHHERFDGTGYPNKLKGVAINLYGRICSIADVYEALTALRPYKNQVTPIGALKIMKDEMMQHFHLPLFEKFANLLVDR